MPGTLDDLVTRVEHRLAGAALRDLPDDELLDRFLRRDDQAAFTALVERHVALVLSVCRRMLGHTPDAEDAFQSTFLILARRAKTIRWQACIRGCHDGEHCHLHFLLLDLLAQILRRTAYHQARDKYSQNAVQQDAI